MSVDRQPCRIETVAFDLVRKIAWVPVASILLREHSRAWLFAEGGPCTIEIVPHHRGRSSGKLISERFNVLHLICGDVDD